MDPYLTAKWLHILSSTVLFGTGIGTAFQMVWAMRSKRAQPVHTVSAGVVVADWLFTTPAGVIQPLTGLWLIHLQGYWLLEPWLLVSYALYTLAFVCWVPVLRLQLRIRDLTREAMAQAGGDTSVPEAALRAYRLWFALGWPAFAALIAVFWVMISKPVLW